MILVHLIHEYIHSQFTLSTPRNKLFISCATQQCWIDGEVWGRGLPKGYSHLLPSKWNQKLFCKMDFLRARYTAWETTILFNMEDTAWETTILVNME